MPDLHNRVHQHLPTNCGHCGDCRWWQSDANAGTDHGGLCLHEELAHFELEVSAESGCNRFQVDQSRVAEGVG
jgi:hypothetical protein